MNRNRSMLWAILLATALVFVYADEEKYSSKYDGINVEEILANNKLRNQYVNCFMGTGPCVTPDAKYFSEMFPEAFVTKCKRCTEKQVQVLDRVTSWYVENEPETWERIVNQIYKKLQNKGEKKDSE